MAITYAALRSRYLDDTRTGGPGATPALGAALEAIGWRAVRDPSPAELADHLRYLLDSCVHEHRDLSALEWQVAMALRDSGPLLDGGLPPVEAYLPAAAEVIARYVHAAAGDGAGPPPELGLFPGLA